MTSLLTLMQVAMVFWTGAAPGDVEQHCPAGVRTAVAQVAQMDNQGKGIQAEAALGSCVITFRAGWRRDLSDRQACGVVIHEVGHAALSLHHSAGGIMSAVIPQRLPGVCARFTNHNRDE
jgi:hypothetical protein